MNKSVPYWYKLISYWVNEKNKEGLTIPFIIEAEEHVNPGVTITLKSVSELITDIIDTDLGDKFTLFFCPTIGNYVLGINNSSYAMKGQEIKSAKTNKTRLIATLSTEILGKNIDEIISSLTRDYYQCLSDKQYSYDNNSWRSFSDAEIDIIRQALQTKL